MGKLINSYHNGLNRDISKTTISNKDGEGVSCSSTLFDAQNIRLISNEEGSTLTVTNVDGNVLALLSNTESGVYIGHCTIRNILVLFLQVGTSTKILKYNTDTLSTTASTTGTIIYNGTYLGFTTTSKIECVGRYESDTIQKVYFIDGNNVNSSLRYINIIQQYDSTNISKTNILQNMVISNVDFKDFHAGGKLLSGMYTYAFRYYNTNGVESNFTIESQPVYVSESISTAGNLNQLTGNELNTDCNVSIECTISNIDNTWENIEIIEFYYSSFNVTPTIRIIHRIKLDSNITSIKFVSVGANYLGNIDLLEYTKSSNPIYAKTIDIKDNKLYLGNISESMFWPDEIKNWDSRAYSCNRFGNIELYTSNDTSFINPEYTGTITNIDSFSETIPVDADCVNLHNDITLDGDQEDNATTFKYNAILPEGVSSANINYMGALGKNIKVRFKIKELPWVPGSPKDPTGETVNTDYSVLPVMMRGEQSYSDWYKWYIGNYRSFQQDEIYRFGIIFYDKFGRQSFVKWIADIRIPIALNTSFRYGEVIEFVYPYIQILHLPVNTNSLISGYRIVHAKREEWDKTITSTGFIGNLEPSQLGDRVGYYFAKPVLDLNTTLSDFRGCYFQYASPEHQFLNKKPDVNDKLEWLGRTEVTYDNIMSDGGYFLKHNICFNNIDKTVGIGSSNVMNAKFRIQRSVSSINKVIIHPDDYINPHNYINLDALRITPWVGWEDIDANANERGNKTSAVYLDISYGKFTSVPNTTSSCARYPDTPATINNSLYCVIRKEIRPYGGYSNIARLNNKYIASSNYHDISSLSSDLLYGDTFITFFDYLHCVAGLGSNSRRKMVSNMIFPLQSSLNLNMINNGSVNRGYPQLSRFDERYIQEYKGEYDGDGNILKQEHDYYIYNEVYNSIPISNIYFPEPYYFKDNNVDDTLIKFSEKKYNGEEKDSWLKFLSNNSNNVDSKYGSLLKIIEFSNEIFFFQEHGFGALSIDPRITSVGDDGISTVLGTGQGIDKIVYLSTSIGLSLQSDVIKSKVGLYWLYNKKLYCFNGKQVIILSDVYGMKSYFEQSVKKDSKLIGVSDDKYNEILFTITNVYDNSLFTYIDSDTLQGDINNLDIQKNANLKIGSSLYNVIDLSGINITFGSIIPIGDVNLSSSMLNKNRFTLCFSETLNKFTSFYSILPSKYIPYSTGFLSHLGTSGNLYIHNIQFGNSFLGSAITSTFDIILTKGSYELLQGDNVFFYTEVFDSNGNLLEGITLDSITAYTDIMQTDEVKLYTMLVDRTNEDLNSYSPESVYELDTSGYNLVTNLVVDTTVTPNRQYRLYNVRRNINGWNTPIPRFKSISPNVDYSDKLKSSYIRLKFKLKQNVKTIVHEIVSNVS